MAKRKATTEAERYGDWEEYVKKDARKDHKHRDEKKSKSEKRFTEGWKDEE